MSLGIGVGDIVSIFKLVVRVHTVYKSAPDDYNHLSEDVKSLQTNVDRAMRYLKNTSLDNSQRQEGQEALQGCQSVLKDLNFLITEYEGLASGSMKQAIKRVKLGTEDIMPLRTRLASNTVLLTSFIQRFVIPVIATQPTDKSRFTVLHYHPACD